MDLKLVQRFLPYAAIAIITTLSLWSRRSQRCRAKSGRSNGSEDGEAEASSLPSSSPPPVREDGFQFDVFLSFRGPDTRKTFVDLLYEALKDKGIITFIDSEKLEKGQKLEVLLECIQRSQIFVPIFSPGYADSEWCLKEIAQMVECKRVILPVFVGVEPRDVRGQSAAFESAFSEHRNNKEIDEVEVSKWRNALKEAGSASGYTLASTNGYLGKLIQQIVKRILSEVNKTSKLRVAQHPVGLDSRVVDVIKVLEIEAQGDLRTVGICGIGGIGKTTLSKAVYNGISSRFDACSFISNIREAAERPSGLVSLQKQLLADVFSDEDVTIRDTSDGLGQIEKRIGAKKVVLVLDDVNDVSQINELVGQLEWFCSGSRIIITTRDKRVLTSARVKENHVYELKGLDDIQSLELFSWHAFGKKEPDAKFAELSNQVASTAAGLPLALTIFGSHFFDLKTDKHWRAALKKLKENLDKDIFDRLRISFDMLDKSEKEVFLDIACFFVGQETKCATLMWEACGFYPEIAIDWLIHKSLVSINNKGIFEMHDLVRDMGRKIVQDKAKEAGKHTRLWNDDETLDVLQNKRGIEDVEAIKLFRVRKEGSVYVDLEHLAAMSQLRMLLLQGVTLKGGYEHFPRKLRWLKSSPQALEKLPSSLHLEMIAVLDLSCSSITQVCDPQKMTVKGLDLLETLDLCNWENLTKRPAFTSLLNWLSNLKYLRELDLSWTDIEELPVLTSSMEGLKELELTGCRKLVHIPGIEQLKRLEKLMLAGCRSLHDSFFERLQAANFRNLRRLSIPGRLINERSTDPQSITFILPKQFDSGLLCLYVDQRSLDNICSELEKSNGASTLLDKSVASEYEVTQPVDGQLGRSVVHIDITTDDAHFSFPTFINGWGESGRFPTATFAKDSELMMMAKQGRFKGNDAQGRGLMEMCVSIDGCVLLHGDLWIPKWTAFEKDKDACRVSHNIVHVSFG